MVFIGFFFVTPAFFIYLGSRHLQTMYEANALAEIGAEISESFITAKTFEVDPACFWSQTFFNIKNEIEQSSDAEKTAAKWRNVYNKSFEYVIWDSEAANPAFSSDFISRDYDWGRLWELVFFICSIKTKDSMNSIGTQPKISPDSWRFFQSFFGPHISLYKIQRGMNSESRLIWGNYDQTSPLWWGFFAGDKKKRGFFRLKRESLHVKTLLKSYFSGMRHEGKPYRFGNLHSENHTPEASDLKKKMVDFVMSPDNMGQQNFQWQGDYYFPRKFADMVFYAVVSREDLLKGFLIRPVWVTVIFCFIFVPVFWQFMQLLDEEKRAFLSISRKIAFLFVYAAGLPLLILSVCAIDYLDKKQSSLIESASRQGLDCVRQFDQDFKSFMSKKDNQVDAVVDRFEKNVREQGVTYPLFQQLQQELIGKGRFSRLNQIFFVHPSGLIFDIHGQISNEKYIFTVSKPPHDMMALKMAVFADGFIKILNRQPLVGKAATELEMIFDTLFGKTPDYIFGLIIESLEDIFMYGWGTEEFPSYCTVMALDPANPLAMHFLFIIWPENMLQLEYIDEQILNANKNADAFKLVVMANSFGTYAFPESLCVDGALAAFSNKISATKGYVQGNVVIAGKRYLTGGFKGANLNFFNMMYLYPYEKIDAEMYNEVFELLTTIVVVLLLTFLSGLMLVKVFLVPIVSITAGVRAIEKRVFTYKAEYLSDDEFGALTKILNQTIADLEELNIASIVQKKLFPKPGFCPGNFSIVAKTVPLNDLGGDYYDYFKTSENGFAMLLGDVAGHGVGAALIMAMAKAGTIYLGSRLARPSECLEQLHKLIKAIKSKKQKKFMTLQYIAVDSSSGRGLYSNAGGCAPLFFRKRKNIIEEIQVAGSALGMFEKTNFTEEVLQFEPGDAIILYTDGIIEAAGRTGEVLGYEKFKEIVHASYDYDAEKFCNGIFEKYYAHLGSCPPSDDVTILIALLKPEMENG